MQQVNRTEDEIWAEIIREEIEAEAQRPPTPSEPYRPNPHGFSTLKTSYPKLYRQWRNHIKVCFDCYDYAFKSAAGTPIRANDKETLNFWLDRRNKRFHKPQGRFYRRLRSFSLRDIEAHCEGHSTLYYTSNPRGQWAVLLIDIDNKDGTAGDVKQVWDAFSHMCPNVYNQTSTGGRGWHGYLVVKYSESVAAFRTLCKRFEDALQDFIHARYKAKIEIKGIPALTDQFGAYVTCGMQAKIPRLASASEIEDYLSRPFFTPAHLEDLIGQLSLQTTHASSPPSDIVMKTSVSRSKTNVFITISERREAAVAGRETDPCKRMNSCGWNLSKRLKRAATAGEILDEYESQGLATGEDKDGNRAKLAEDSATWCQTNYDPKKQDSFDLQGTVDLVARHVTNDTRETTRLAISDEQLAVVLYCIERGSTTRHQNPKLQFTAANNGFVNMFETLGIELEGAPDSQRMKLAAMKRILVLAGLAEVVNPNWTTGRGKAFGLGPNHPRHEEYRALRMSIKMNEPDVNLPDGIIKLSRR